MKDTELDINTIIRIQRIKKGMSQMELAEAIGASRTFVQNVEQNDNAALQRLQKLFKELDIKITCK